MREAEKDTETESERQRVSETKKESENLFLHVLIHLFCRILVSLQ